MPTLSQTTALTKKILIFGGGGLLAIILLFFLSRGGITLYNTLFPKPGPPPEAAFNTLPAVIFPESTVQGKFSYSLDTVTGSLGNFPDRAKVFKTVPKEPNLLSLQDTQSLLRRSRFTFNQTRLNDTTYSWNETLRIDKRLTINIVSKDFEIVSNFLTYPDLAAIGAVDQENATGAVTSFLSTLNLFPLDIDLLKTKIDLLKVVDGELVAATSPSDAQVARVDLYQADIEKMPIMYPNPPHSTMHFLVGGKNTNEIMEAIFNHQTIGQESSTYPIISVNDAYTILKKGNAYIGSYFGSEKDITIKEVFLGYYLGEQKQQYLMPIYVFEGKDGFSAYVSAIKNDWINATN